MNSEVYLEQGDKMGLLTVIMLAFLVTWLGGIAFEIAGAFTNILLIATIFLFFMRIFRKAI